MSGEATERERRVLWNAVGNVLSNAMNFPENVQARLLGQDMAPLTERVVNAILKSDYRSLARQEGMRQEIPTEYALAEPVVEPER